MVSSGATWRANTLPTPCWNGSPEARTHTGRPRKAEHFGYRLDRRGLPHGRAAPRIKGAASER